MHHESSTQAGYGPYHFLNLACVVCVSSVLLFVLLLILILPDICTQPRYPTPFRARPPRCPHRTMVHTTRLRLDPPTRHSILPMRLLRRLIRYTILQPRRSPASGSITELLRHAPKNNVGAKAVGLWATERLFRYCKLHRVHEIGRRSRQRQRQECRPSSHLEHWTFMGTKNYVCG